MIILYILRILLYLIITKNLIFNRIGVWEKLKRKY